MDASRPPRTGGDQRERLSTDASHRRRRSANATDGRSSLWPAPPAADQVGPSAGREARGVTYGGMRVDRGGANCHQPVAPIPIPRKGRSGALLRGSSQTDLRRRVPRLRQMLAEGRVARHPQRRTVDSAQVAGPTNRCRCATCIIAGIDCPPDPVSAPIQSTPRGRCRKSKSRAMSRSVFFAWCPASGRAGVRSAPTPQLVRVDLVAQRQSGHRHTRPSSLLDDPALECRHVRVTTASVRTLNALTFPDHARGLKRWASMRP